MGTVAVAVEPSSAIEMIGPYLAAQVTCPFCKQLNEFTRLEGPLSHVKVIAICGHVKAHFLDDDLVSQFEFQGDFDDLPHDFNRSQILGPR